MRHFAGLVVFICMFAPTLVGAQGLVPCGGPGQEQCQTCHVVVIMNNVLMWTMSILALLAGIVILVIGFSFVTSRGEAGVIQKGKRMFANIFIGLIIVFVAWLTVDLIAKNLINGAIVEGPWNVISCVDQPVFRVGLPDILTIRLLQCNDPDLTDEEYVALGCLDIDLDKPRDVLIDAGYRITQCALNFTPTQCVDWCLAEGGTLRPGTQVEGGVEGEYYCIVSPRQSYGGRCEVMTGGPCTITNLTRYFGARADEASRICSIESGGNPVFSTTDLCCGPSGNCNGAPSFSGGIFQINILAHADKIPGCTGNFYNRNGSTIQGDCVVHKTNSNGVTYCAGWSCEITDAITYNRCIEATTDVTLNLEIASQLFQDSGFQPWTTSANTCSIPF